MILIIHKPMICAVFYDSRKILMCFCVYKLMIIAKALFWAFACPNKSINVINENIFFVLLCFMFFIFFVLSQREKYQYEKKLKKAPFTIWYKSCIIFQKGKI